MIKVELIKAGEEYHKRTTCYNDNCLRLPEYIQPLKWSDHYIIKPGTTITKIILGQGYQGHQEYYCQGCADEIFKLIKIKMDPSLRAFQ